MPLPTPNLDDRTFQSFVDEAKRRIPQHCPEWTNHNVSDPGVALIELFAWMSELVLFRVNQVPERLYSHFLNMVGIEPFPPSVATVDLTFWLSAVRDKPTTVARDTEVTTSGGATGQTTPVVFSTTETLVIAPPVLVAQATFDEDTQEAVDITEELKFSTDGADCFPVHPGVALRAEEGADESTVRPGDAFCLAFAESLAGVVLEVGIVTDAPAGRGINPDDPPLSWEVWNGKAWITCAVESDSTGGLNRTGSVVLLVPREHEPRVVGERTAYWLRATLRDPQRGRAYYQRSPRIRRIEAYALGGTVTAQHAEKVAGEQIGRSDGTPGQQFGTSRAPVLTRREGQHVETVVPGDDPVVWREVEDFSRSGEHDRHFVWDGTTGTVRFGPKVRYKDGSSRQHGAVPVDGARIMVTGYHTGGGSRGNVGAHTLTAMRSDVQYVRGVINPAEAYGGVDGETVAEAQVRAPLTLRTGQRAVTPGDFERLAAEVSTEIARTRCNALDRGHGLVQLLVVPKVGKAPIDTRLDDFALSEGLTAQITERLDQHRLIGTAIELQTPRYQGVSVAAMVTGVRGRAPDLVAHRAKEEISRFLHPTAGGADGRGWPFDAHVNAAVITQMLEEVDGIERVDELVLFEYDLREQRRIGDGKSVIRLARESLFLAAGLQVVVR